MEEKDIFLKEIDWAKWQAHHRLFAILDCAHTDESIWRSVTQMRLDARRSLFEGTPDEGLNNVEPVLLDALHPSYLRLMPWLLEVEKKQNMVLWFVSNRPIDELHKNLRDLLVVDLPDAPDSLLRFYDPSVFIKLMAVMNPAQRALFFTKIDQWSAWNARSAKRHTFTAAKTQGQAALPLTFSEAQLQAFSQLDVADFVHDATADIVNTKAKLKHAKDLSDQTVALHVGEHINQAVAYGLETEEAIQAYLLCVAGALGWEFAQEGKHEKATHVLKDTSCDEDTKLERLQTYCAAL